ncbi:hypothetical protein CC1G_06244 [Coprinopsis cinerea okayama7|uniref:F-box domain-containing protein n=1 Tax=Coprinopsis cinerea (strain Okayama-7 / 130 / ATCC MYA-4618 / FGSC 9003) TaxID=240176 RepID=A8NVC8_COPC7|nr:hypothetical protein CC1G_06244 [Coprinopsis cinerea okayama7\|eukprot:XP_001836657.2 hypothetical protein CC1G_06244 [Coprinopsis cinerea okayama7\
MASKWKMLRSLAAAGKLETEKEDGEERRSLSSKIAKVFAGMGKDVRPLQASPLLELPYELLDRILFFLDREDLMTLRAVCYRLDELLLDQLFSEISINCTQYGSQRTGALLRQLSTGKSRVSRVAKTLHIANLVPFTHPAQSNWQETDLDQGLRPIQQSYLAPALRALRNITTVHWSVKVSDPYSSMCDALAALPHLDSLYLYLDRWTHSTLFPFDKFHDLKLKRLHFESGDYFRPITCETIPHLRKIIAGSPDLEELSFTPLLIQGPRITTLDDLFIRDGETKKCLKENGGVLPLTSIRLAYPMLSKEMHTWGALKNLVSLDITNGQADIRPLWKFFSAHSFELQVIKVGNLSFELIEYLLTYTGLRELHLRSVFAAEGKESSRKELMTALCRDGLPQHGYSLEMLSLEAPDSDVNEEWCLMPEYASWIGHLLQPKPANPDRSSLSTLPPPTPPTPLPYPGMAITLTRRSTVDRLDT